MLKLVTEQGDNDCKVNDIDTTYSRDEEGNILIEDVDIPQNEIATVTLIPEGYAEYIGYFHSDGILRPQAEPEPQAELEPQEEPEPQEEEEE